MHIITMYLRAASVKGTLVDEWNQTVSSLPALTRGLRAELVLKLVDANGSPLEDSALDYATWDFAIANDWDTTTKPQIRVKDGITVAGNEVHVPLTETNTEELVAALGKSESMTFGCELAGFEVGETSPGFLLQFDISIRNRRADAGTGSPAPVDDGTYSAAQVRALLAARLEVQVSDDGAEWRTADPADGTPDTARWYRFRNAKAGLEWSDPLPLLVGPRGERATVSVGKVEAGNAGSQPIVANVGDEYDAVFDFTIPAGARGEAATVRVGSAVAVGEGEEPEVTNSGTSSDAVLDFRIPRGPTGATGHASYLYVAYAEKSDGTGFSLVPASSLKYRAEIQSDAEIESPQLSDFASAAWVKYLGDDSTVYGDVLVADADTSVAKVSRIVFENAKIRKGIDGEVIVNFKEAGVTDDEMNRYAVVNARTLLSPWTNGGGSPTGGLDADVVTPASLPEVAEMPTYSSFAA